MCAHHSEVIFKAKTGGGGIHLHFPMPNLFGLESGVWAKNFDETPQPWMSGQGIPNKDSHIYILSTDQQGDQQKVYNLFSQYKITQREDPLQSKLAPLSPCQTILSASYHCNWSRLSSYCPGLTSKCSYRSSPLLSLQAFGHQLLWCVCSHHHACLVLYCEYKNSWLKISHSEI